MNGTTTDVMMHAYRTLAKGAEEDPVERPSLIAELLKGTSAVWAWFSLYKLRTLSEDEKTQLCRIVLKNEDYEMAVWCLETTVLSETQRSMLKNMLTNTKLTSLAQMALWRIPDFSDAQRVRLTKIASGLDPDAI